MPIVLPAIGTSLRFASTADLEAVVGVTGSWEALTSFAVAGVGVTQSYLDALYYVIAYIGEHNVPSDIRQLRRSVFQVMRRMGQPVIVKHMYNDHDAKVGLAQPSPIAADGYGQQVRNRDPFSFGSGYCSIQLSTDEWVNPTTGSIVTSVTSPGPTYAQAPMYRGYGPGYLTYIIEPDTPLDLFKLSSAGALIKIQSQTVVSGWYPEINDNDLLINVEMDADGHVSDSHERYQAKMSRPITMRGLDQRGRREYSADHGNRHVVNQQFEMSLLPETSVLYQVATDR